MSDKLLRITSRDRASSSRSKYDITFQTSDRDLANVRQIELKSAIIPNTYYNVNSNNNTWLFNNTLNGTSTFTIPVGQYTTSTLITELQSQVPGLTVTQSTLTEKLSFNIAGTYDFTSLADGNLMAPLLGIENTQNGLAGTTVADNMPDLTGLRHVYLFSNTLTDDVMHRAGKVRQNVFATIPITVPFGNSQVHEEAGGSDTHDDHRYIRTRDISNIDMKLLDSDDNVIDLNGLEWEVILKVRYE